MAGSRRWRGAVFIVAVWLVGAWYMLGPPSQFTRGLYDSADYPGFGYANEEDGPRPAVRWEKRRDRYPITSLTPLPTDRPSVKIPQIQAPRPKESPEGKQLRLQRQAAVKASFQHSWKGYVEHAWLHDEVTPVYGKSRDPFGGWAATLVDTLDTLWIMGMKGDFAQAVKACDRIDFSVSSGQVINVFETTIRYLGGFLASYELSKKKYPSLLKKAVEVGELLMCAFDTPNRMPITRWNWIDYTNGIEQEAPKTMLVSEIASLSLEFTKLSQLTGDMKYYDAVQRIADEFERGQNASRLPGMWPIVIDAAQPSFDGGSSFSLGGMSDSAYEYLPKQYMILGGRLTQPRKMYERFIDVAKHHLFFRASNPTDTPILFPGDVEVGPTEGDGIKTTPSYRAQHLTCFTGGMVGIASRIFDRPDDLEVAAQITDGCVWAYQATPSGVGPEIFHFVPCGRAADAQGGAGCAWSAERWERAVAEAWGVPAEQAAATAEAGRLPPGMPRVDDTRYILRPEAVESVFVMYRLTGDARWMDKAWAMWERVEAVSRTGIAASAVDDVTKRQPRQTDSMESFWLAETLKYFYLVFGEWDTVNLDEWVLNTEAHPLRRIK